MVDIRKIFRQLKEKLGIIRRREKRRERKTHEEQHVVVRGVIKAEYKKRKGHERIVEVEFTARLNGRDIDEERIIDMVEDRIEEDEYLGEWFFSVPWEYTVGIEEYEVLPGRVREEVEIRAHVV